MASHESLVDLIFAKLALVYGRDFLGRWEGQDIAEVKADWQRELSRSLNHPEAVRYALENLPADKNPPNVLQFRALCIGRPEPEVRELPWPKASDAVVAAAVKGVFIPKESDPKAWAYRLRNDERGGLRLSAAQKTMWRAALGHEDGAKA